MNFLVFLVGIEKFLLPVKGLPKRARFLAILGLIFLTLINVGLEFLEGNGAPKLKASLRSVLSFWSFIFWNGWKASIVLALFLGSTSSTLESWIKRTMTDQSTVIFKTYFRREDSQPESQKVKRKDVCHGPCFWWLRLFIVVSSLLCLIQVYICILFIYQLAPTPQLWPRLASLMDYN